MYYNVADNNCMILRFIVHDDSRGICGEQLATAIPTNCHDFAIIT